MKRRLPPIISIVGKKATGKTTLIEKIVPELKKRGFKVGTIKHDVHGFEIDYEGKDSFRHFHSGADATMIYSPEKLAFVTRLDSPPSLDQVRETFFQGVDIIITEGFKSLDKPKIEVFRSTVHNGLLCTDKDNLIAVISDKNLAIATPQFNFDNISGLVDFIQERFLSLPKP